MCEGAVPSNINAASNRHEAQQSGIVASGSLVLLRAHRETSLTEMCAGFLAKVPRLNVKVIPLIVLLLLL